MAIQAAISAIRLLFLKCLKCKSVLGNRRQSLLFDKEKIITALAYHYWLTVREQTRNSSFFLDLFSLS